MGRMSNPCRRPGDGPAPRWPCTTLVAARLPTRASSADLSRKSDHRRCSLPSCRPERVIHRGCAFVSPVGVDGRDRLLGPQAAFRTGSQVSSEDRKTQRGTLLPFCNNGFGIGAYSFVVACLVCIIDCERDAKSMSRFWVGSS